MSRLIISEDLREYLKRVPDLELDLLFEAYERPLPEGFRVNTLKAEEDYVLERLEAKGFNVKTVPWARHGYIVEEGELGGTLEHMLGLVYMQGPVSMAPVEVLDPRPGDLVLDLCAAPGSKSTQIAQLLDGKGVLVANDVSFERVKALSSNLQRFGVFNVVLTLMDGRRFPRFARRFFDKVLVDAPCSSLGVISKDWGVARNWRYGAVERLARLQLQLLLAGFDVLKPGGVLVYATCTLTVEENEMVLDRFLKLRDKASVQEFNLKGLNGRPGLLEWEGMCLNPELGKTMRIMPYDNWAEGFYIARIVKKGE